MYLLCIHLSLNWRSVWLITVYMSRLFKRSASLPPKSFLYLVAFTLMSDLERKKFQADVTWLLKEGKKTFGIKKKNCPRPQWGKLRPLSQSARDPLKHLKRGGSHSGSHIHSLHKPSFSTAFLRRSGFSALKISSILFQHFFFLPWSCWGC